VARDESAVKRKSSHFLEAQDGIKEKQNYSNNLGQKSERRWNACVRCICKSLNIRSHNILIFDCNSFKNHSKHGKSLRHDIGPKTARKYSQEKE
jgi:hypothetical protein